MEEEFTQKRMSSKTFLRLMSFLLPYKRRLIFNLVFTLLATISQLLGPKFIQIGIDRYLTSFTTAKAALNGILIVSLIYLVNLLMGWFLSVAQVKSAIAVGQGAMNDLRLAVFEHIQRLSLNYFDKTHQGRIISRADTDIDSLDRIMTLGANQLLASGLTLIGVITLLLNAIGDCVWQSASSSRPSLSPRACSTSMGCKRIEKCANNPPDHGGNGREYYRRACRQAFSREDENLARFQRIHEVYSQYAVAAARVFHTYLPFVGLMSGLGTVVILGYGSTLVMHREITVGELAAFVLYLGMFFGPIQTMGDLYNAVLSTAASAEQYQLLDTEPQIKDRPGAHPLPPIRGHVAFEHVWFRYDTTPADIWVLKDIHFEAKPGKPLRSSAPPGRQDQHHQSSGAFLRAAARSHHYRWS